MASDARELRCGRDISQFSPKPSAEAEKLGALPRSPGSYMDERFFVSGRFSTTSRFPSRQAPCASAVLDMNCPRMRRVARALLLRLGPPQPFAHFSLSAAGRLRSRAEQRTTASRAMDRDKQPMIYRSFAGRALADYFAASRRRYRVLPDGLKALSALLLSQGPGTRAAPSFSTRSGVPLC